MKTIISGFVCLLFVCLYAFDTYSQGTYSKPLTPITHVTSGDVYVQDLGFGFVTKSADGNCWRQKVSNEGKTYWQSVPCSTNKSVGFSIQPNPDQGKDGFITNNSPYAIRDLYVINPVGYWTVSGNPATSESLIQIDIPSIPSNATIDSVFLYLYFYPLGSSSYSQHSGSNSFYINRITSSWNETSLYWNYQPTYVTTNQVYVPPTTSSTQDLKINITNLVKDCFDSATGSFPSNFGFIFVPINITSLNMVTVGSSDCLDATKRPKLSVFYSVP